MTQTLTPLHPDELERLRADYDKLPVHDPRRRLLAMLDQARMEMDVLRRLLVDEGKEVRELRAELDRKQQQTPRI